MKNILKDSLFLTYSYFSTLFETFFFRKFPIKYENNYLSDEGYVVYPINQKININLKNIKTLNINPYLSKIELSNDQINNFIEEIFIKSGIYTFLRKKTGFNFCISHITAYEIKHIPKNESHENFYANLWHKDGPYSKNTLKIVLPLEDITMNNGPMNIYPRALSDKFPIYQYKFKGNLKSYYQFEGKKYEKTLIFNPHLCFHRAGNPKPNLTRRQIVFQINPSFQWCFCKNIYKTQFDMEPKFPLLNYRLYDVKKMDISMH